MVCGIAELATRMKCRLLDYEGELVFAVISRNQELGAEIREWDEDHLLIYLMCIKNPNQGKRLLAHLQRFGFLLIQVMDESLMGFTFTPAEEQIKELTSLFGMG